MLAPVNRNAALPFSIISLWKRIFHVMCTLAMFSIMQVAAAQSGFTNLSFTPNGGTVGADGTLAVSFFGNVNAIDFQDEVSTIRLHEGGAILKEITYNLGYDRFGVPLNTTFSFGTPISLSAGTHQLYWEAITVNGGFNSQTMTVVVQPPPYNGAAFISQSVPENMVAGQVYSVSVTMANTGTKTWSPGGATPYNLGSRNPFDNLTWNVGRVAVPGTVPPGAQATFNFQVTAPQSGGAVNFQFGMVQDGVEWFGPTSANVVVQVSIPQPSVQFLSPADGASFTNVTGFGYVPVSGTGAAGTGATITSLKVLDNGVVFTGIAESRLDAVVPTGIGSHVIELRLTDSRGQVASAFRTVNVIGPAVATFTSPPSGTTFTYIGAGFVPKVTAQATSATGGGVSKLRFSYDGQQVADYPGSTMMDAIQMLPGSHTLSIAAVDTNGTIGPTSSISVVVKLPDPPVASFASPISGASFVAAGNAANVNVNATGTPATDVTVSKMNFYIDGVLTQTVTGNTLSIASPLAIGTHVLAIEAIDSVGTTGPRQSISVTVVGPPPPASAAFSSPANNAYFIVNGTTATVPVAASGTPAAGATISQLSLYVDGVLTQTAPSSTLSISVALTAGTHTLGIEAVDN